MSTNPPQTRPLALLGIAAAAVVVGGIVGATTNAINGAVSPEYFRAILPWDDVENIWRASLAQGIFAGLIYGVFFSVVFTLVVGIVSRAQCTFAFAFRSIGAIVGGVYICWVVGGVIGLGLAALSPDFFERTFMGVPEDQGEMLRYAWVGGSIFGAMSGAILATVPGCILFAVRWRRLHLPRS